MAASLTIRLDGCCITSRIDTRTESATKRLGVLIRKVVMYVSFESFTYFFRPELFAAHTL